MFDIDKLSLPLLGFDSPLPELEPSTVCNVIIAKHLPELLGTSYHFQFSTFGWQNVNLEKIQQLTSTYKRRHKKGATAWASLATKVLSENPTPIVKDTHTFEVSNMNYPFDFDTAKAIEIILYIANIVAQPTFHRISKVMYFADKAHLEKYGRFICHDNYVAMKHGPVPSGTYNILKVVRGDSFIPLASINQAKNAFIVIDKSMVKPLRTTNFDYLSQSVLGCLDNAIKQYGHLSFSELTELSHDKAWEVADENDCIDIEQIVATLANSDDLLEYLRDPHIKFSTDIEPIYQKAMLAELED